jgi:hypothetical protein
MRFILRELMGFVGIGVTVGSILIAAEGATALVRRALALLTGSL